MSERKRKRGRPRKNPLPIGYEAEMRMRNNIPRNIKKPKYLLDAEEESNASRGSTPVRNFDEGSSHVVGKNSRGYNPEFDDKNSEFHYGSDFEIDKNSDNDAEASDNESSYGMASILSDDEDGVLSDDDKEGIDQSSLGFASAISSPIAPDIVWLQERLLPKLDLPPSADDLLVPLEYLMPSLSVYEVLRHFRTQIRLSPFR